MTRELDADRGYANLQLIAHGPALFNAVVAALELDLFDFLSANPGADFGKVRAVVKIPGHQLRVLLLTLSAIDLVVRQDGGFRNTPVAERQLTARHPDSWRHIFLSRHRTDYHGLAHATSALRAGTNTGLAVHPGDGDTLYARLAGDAKLQRDLYASVTAFTERTAPALIDHPELADVTHVLDVGGGSGAISKRFLGAYPHSEATVFDLPSVVGLASDEVPDEVSGRLHLHGGDIVTDDFPNGPDGILFCHVLEVFPVERIAELLAKAYAALPVNGKALIYAFNARDDDSGGMLAAQLSFYLNVLATGCGMAYPAAEFAALLRAAGFDTVRTYSGLPYEHGLVVGVKV